MIWLLPIAQASQEEVPPAPIEPQHLLAVFDEPPTDKARGKAIRYAMRKSKSLQGGKDWGRALCFRFDGPADVELIQAAIIKTGVPAELRPANDCMVPPPEALLPPKAAHAVGVHLTAPEPPSAIRNALMSLLGIGGLGLVGVRTLDGPSDTFCLEFAEVPAEGLLDFTLTSLPFSVASTEVVDKCVDAFVAPR